MTEDGFDSFRAKSQEESNSKSEETGIKESRGCDEILLKPLNNYRSLLDSDSEEEEVAEKQNVFTTYDSDNSPNNSSDNSSNNSSDNSNGNQSKVTKKKHKKRLLHNDEEGKDGEDGNSSSSGVDDSLTKNSGVLEKRKLFRVSVSKVLLMIDEYIIMNL